MKKACIKIHHEMEERYSRLVLEYFTLTQKEEIFHVTNETIKEQKVYPSQIMQPKGEFTGEYSLEFNDDYDKVAGDFFEAIIKKLDIGTCEIGVKFTLLLKLFVQFKSLLTLILLYLYDA